MGAKGSLLLEVKDLSVYFHPKKSANTRVIRAVDGVDLSVYRGHTLCLFGESGNGKRTLCRAIAGSASRPHQILSGRLMFYPKENLVHRIDLSRSFLNSMENDGSGIHVALIGQEPAPSLSILHTIGSQVIHAIQQNHKINRIEARRQSVNILRRLGLPQADQLIKEYPFGLPGDMHLLVQLALALSCEPSLLIFDDTAVTLDIPGQAEALDVISAFQQEHQMAVMYATGDLDLAARIADEVAIMYRGKIVEMAGVHSLFTKPKHPYTQALLGRNQGLRRDLQGSSIQDGAQLRSQGCPYLLYCTEALPECSQGDPRMVTVSDRHDVRCFLYEALPTEPLEPCERNESDIDIWQLERFLMQ